LCTYCYCALSTIFFSPLDVHFPLLTVCVHSPTTCASHSNFSMSCCTWSKFFISSTHHSQCTFIISRFVANNWFLILSLLCYCWLSFCSLGYYLHTIFFFNFSLIVWFGFFFGLCLFMFSFVLYFWWMGFYPWSFFIQGFFFYIINQHLFKIQNIV